MARLPMHSPQSKQWFDLSSPLRRHVHLSLNPRGWVHDVELTFAPGEVPHTECLKVADRASRPFVPRVVSRHPDGSLKRVHVLIPVGPFTEQGFPEWVDVYYGGSARPILPPVLWDCGCRALRTPFYRIEFDEFGVVRRMIYVQVDHDLIEPQGGGGMSPELLARGCWKDFTATPPTLFEVETFRENPATLGIVVEHQTPELSLRRRFVFSPTLITLDFTVQTHAEVEFFSPFMIQHRRDSGMVIGPDGRHDPVRVAAGQALSLHSVLPFPGYVFSSQTGLFVVGESRERPFDRFEYRSTGGRRGSVGLGFHGLRSEEKIQGRIYLVPAPFAGDFGLERAVQLHEALARPVARKPRVGAAEKRPVAFAPVVTQQSKRIAIETGGQKLLAELHPGQGYHLSLGTRKSSRLLSMDRFWGIETREGEVVWARPSSAQVDAGSLRLAGETQGPDGSRWRIESRIVPRLCEGAVLFEEERRHILLGTEPVSARWRTEASTPIGPPKWQSGEATVFIPELMGRSNCAPYRHGGGPKWGPSDTPEPCPHCKPGMTGHANRWVAPASRLPNPWAVAADRKKKALALVATAPRSGLGECSVGFHSPDDGHTTLILAAPITYEPWVPHGYGGFDRAPRRDAKTLYPGDEARWRLYYAVRETSNLNDWYDFDAALYHLHAAWRPKAYKMPYERALRLTLGSLYRNFYKPGPGVISYSTGPDGQTAPIGFTGMSHSALVLLEGGSRLRVSDWREAGVRVLDQVAWAFLNGPEFPFVAWVPGKGWSSGSGEPGYLILCALDNLIEALAAERGRGSGHENWERAIRRCCDAWLAAQDSNGAFPLKHPAMGDEFPEADFEATNVTVGVIASLVEASKLLGEPRYLAAARKAASFYGRLLDEGKLWGGPGDIEALVNSEVPMFYLRAFVRLALATGDAKHKQWARDAAAWRLAFQFGHCWALDFGSQLYRQGWAGLGSEGASASNLHSVCFGAINVPDYALARRLFGDDFWSERLRDLADYATQQYGRFDGDVDILRAGQGTESFWTSDTKWGKGNVLLLLDKPNLGYMSWTTAWSAYGLLHALRLEEESRGVEGTKRMTPSSRGHTKKARGRA